MKYSAGWFSRDSKVGVNCKLLLQALRWRWKETKHQIRIFTNFQTSPVLWCHHSHSNMAFNVFTRMPQYRIWKDPRDHRPSIGLLQNAKWKYFTYSRFRNFLCLNKLRAMVIWCSWFPFFVKQIISVLISTFEIGEKY